MPPFSPSVARKGDPSVSAAPDTPVFIISIDTLRADHLPAYGYAKGSTPGIDRFRKDAVLFRSAFSHVPLTLPSHASLMTGLLPYRHGIRDNVGYTLKPEQKTLASILKENGYATGGSVSSFVIRGETGINRGFDEYDDLMTVSPMETLTSWTRDGDLSRELLEKWLDRNAGPRVFGFLHLYEPHGPYTPPEPFKSRFASEPYDGEIAYADAIVGKFLDDLRAKGLYDRALIVLMSDHGEGLGDHGELAHGVLLYNEAIQVPLLVKLPGGERAGQEVTSVASIVDLLPTILGRVGIAAPQGLDGVDLFVRRGGRSRDLQRVVLPAPPLRVEGAPLVLRREASLHRSADGRALRPGGRSSRDEEHRGRGAESRVGQAARSGSDRRRASFRSRARRPGGRREAHCVSAISGRARRPPRGHCPIRRTNSKL